MGCGPIFALGNPKQLGYTNSLQRQNESLSHQIIPLKHNCLNLDCFMYVLEAQYTRFVHWEAGKGGVLQPCLHPLALWDLLGDISLSA